MALVDTTWYVNSVGYMAITVRPQNAAVAAGVLCRQFTAPAAGSERVFVCIVAGTTANTTDATWVLTRGAKTTDGTVTWMECSGQAALNGDLTNTTTWAQVKAATPAVLGQIIKRSNNASYQICTTAGAMSASEPAFSDTAGVTTTDTTAVWTSLGVISNFTGGQAPHARWTTAFSASGWATTDNTIYIGDNSAETVSGNLSSFGSSAIRLRTLCHNHSGSYPPTSSDLTIGASFSITGFIQFYSSGAYYFYGMTFKGNLVFGANSNTNMNWYYFDSCLFWLTTGNALNLGCDNAPVNWNNIIFNNCRLKFDATSGCIVPRNIQFVWKNSGTGPILASGSFVPALLFNVAIATTFSALLEGLDLSQLTGSLYNPNAVSNIGSLTIKDCKLNASNYVTTPINTGMTVQLVRCDSAATAYKSSRYAYEGTETTETSITRIGGAVDPTGQAQSRKIVTTANAQWLRPFQAEPYAIWNDVIGTNRVVTVYGTVNAGVLPMNDDLWMEVEYLGDAGSAAVYATLDGVAGSATLSNGNKTATFSGGGTGGARSAALFSSGKYYYEVTVGQTTGANDFVGFAISSVTYSNIINAGTVNAGGVYFNHSAGAGIVSVNNVGPGNLGRVVAGDVVCVAIDVSANLVWFRRNNGNWNASSSNNPATGVGGVAVVVSGSVAPVVAFNGANGDNMTANFGQSAFTYVVPSGFMSGWGTAATTVSPLGKIVTTTKASVLAANAAVASDNSTWNNAPSTPFDSYITSVKLLMGFDGVNGSTSAPGMADESFAARGTATIGGAAQIGTARSVFGGSSLLLDGTSAYIQYPDHADFNLSNQPFTVECRIYATTIAAGIRSIVSQWKSAGNLGWNFWVNANALQFIVSDDGTTNRTLATSNILANTWYAVAFDFDGTKYRLYVDGVMVGSSTTLYTVFDSPQALVIGAMDNTGARNYFSGSIDEFRFTKGVARYASDSGYTVATTAFSRSGWTPFKLVATLSSPQPVMAGYMHVRVRAAKASATYYIDPQVTLG